MRSDGKVVKNVDPMYTLAPYFMRRRSDSQNMITIRVPYADVHKYVLDARKRGHKISHLTVFVAAFLRTVSQYNQLNRFVSNSKIYAHNDFTVAMVVLRAGGGDPSMSKVSFDLYDTIFDVNDKLNAFIEENNKADSNTSTDKLFKTLLKLPFLVRIGMAFFRMADHFGWLPKSLLNLSPFHNTMVVTNLASIRSNYIYHHVYDFGTTSYIAAIGNTEDVPYEKDGEVHLKKMIPIGFVMDERIASGSYYVRAFSHLEKYLKDPTVLEVPPETVNVDYPFEGLSERFKSEKTKEKERRKAEKKAKKQAKNK